MLSDTDLRDLAYGSARPLLVPMPEDHQFQPASIDLRLASEFKQFKRPLRARDNGAGALHVDRPVDPDWMEDYHTDYEFLLEPGAFTLASTVERITMPVTHVARVEGRSSLGRLGLIIHATAGFIDPGFEGNITLEMMNLSPRPLVLRVGMRICQLSFEKLDSSCARPYGHPGLRSRYQGQTGVTASRINEKE